MTDPRAEGHAPTIDLATDAGRAIVGLFAALKALEALGGGWPGADVVDILTGWFHDLGIDVDQPADDLPGANPNRCTSCGAHLAEPHAPGCPVNADIDHDDDPGGQCDRAAITLTYNTPVQVTVADSAVRHVTAGSAAGGPDAVTGGLCAGCGRTLPVDHPAVAAAITAAGADRTWRSWDVLR